MADEKKKAKETKSVTPWRPFMGFSDWDRDMERMMGDIFGRRTRPWWPERSSLPAPLEISAPTIDLYEDKNDIVVKAELPGIDKDNIEVNLTNSTLTIKGEKKKEEEVKEENYYRCERSYGSFLRTLELPKDIHADKVKASFKNGMLEIRLPKTEEAKKKEIKVKVD